VRPLDDEVDGVGAVEGRLAQVRTDLRERAVGARLQGHLVLQRAQGEDAPRLGDLLADVAAAPRRVDGDAFDVEGPAVEQEVGERVLVVELVVGVRIDEDAQSPPVLANRCLADPGLRGGRRRRRRLAGRPRGADDEHRDRYESGRQCPECLHGCLPGLAALRLRCLILPA
jgi:hypothetical protein